MSPKAKKPAVRVARTLTLTPRSEAILESLAELTGVTRGRIVDIAMGNIMACELCQGRGTVNGLLGPDTCVCDACCGARLVPGSSQ